jgi:DNA-binding MarR family transcriptional regulator
MGQSRSEKNQDAVRAILRHWQEALPNDRLAHLLKDTWRGLTRAFQTRLSEHSVSFGHWVFLRILWEKDGLTQSELSQEAGLMMPTTFSALRTMERLGYIYRERQPDSRKKVYIFLTPQGRTLKDELVPLAEEVNAIAIRNVPLADVSATRRTLLAMVANLAQDEINLLKTKRKVPSTRDLVGLGTHNAEGRALGKTPAKEPRTKGLVKGQTRSSSTTSRRSASETSSPSPSAKAKREHIGAMGRTGRRAHRGS